MSNDTSGIRPLTDDEYDIYSGSCSKAIEFVPSFRDSVTLLRPFVDENCPTTYVDEHSRVGIGLPFFTHSINMRATFILHEAMHVLNNHFARTRVLGAKPDLLNNIAEDLEIGTTLELHPRTDTSNQLVPGKGDFQYPKNLTYEQYYAHLSDEINKNNEQPQDPSEGGESGESGEGGQSGQSESGQGQNSDGDTSDSNPGQGNEKSDSGGSGGSKEDQLGKKLEKSGGEACESADADRVQAADDLGVERASDAEKTIAHRNTEARINEEMKRGGGMGNSHMGAFLGRMQVHLAPPKVSWKTIFRRETDRASAAIALGRSDYSYRTVDKKYSESEYIFPGMVSYKPTAMLGLDTSGSMGGGDFKSLMSEAEAVLKSTSVGHYGIKMFTIDTKISGGVQTVRSVKDLKIHGGGGTDMGPAFTYVRKMQRNKRPDIFILGTDGGIPWEPVLKELRLCKRAFKSIILITTKYGWEGVPLEAKRLATIIDLS